MAIDCLNRLEGYWLKHNLNVLRLKLRDNLSEELEIDLVSKINEIQTQLNNIS